MTVSAKKSLKLCYVKYLTAYYYVWIAVSSLSEVNAILQDWATDKFSLPSPLSLPEALIEVKDISDVTTNPTSEVDVYLQSDLTSYNTLVTNNLVLPKTSGKGIQVDVTTPTFGWKDLRGNVITDPAGGDAPVLTVYRAGSVREYLYGATKKADIRFHIPHDYVPGTDIYLHIHWSHNGTAISGNFVCTCIYTYAKSHSQATFPAEKTILVSVSTPTIAAIPQYEHILSEVQLSAAAPSGSQIDSALLEPDGIILMNLEVTTLPTITGGSNGVFIHYIDLHYQSTQLATKAKAPYFYV
jgi:hypothetical protein